MYRDSFYIFTHFLTNIFTKPNKNHARNEEDFHKNKTQHSNFHKIGSNHMYEIL